ncbi:hypothetical protein [Mesobacillus zeae]|uniref:DUF4064 domain-containing protein n=1 Tax=Mesobacillus zeae TaxID=1917180 RepID=A0A398AZB8_9BACI|nr:hypothetical protein [Mesobacillus zeae]RID82925.1 hypothetical protein D1970_17695 [Mesobacillus zeae]
MKNTLIIAGILGILVALAAQLFAINDDAYHFGNIWFAGVLGGAIGVWGGNAVDKSNGMGAGLTALSLLMGFAGVGSLYIALALLQGTSLVGLYLQSKGKGESV